MFELTCETLGCFFFLSCSLSTQLAYCFPITSDLCAAGFCISRPVGRISESTCVCDGVNRGSGWHDRFEPHWAITSCRKLCLKVTLYRLSSGSKPTVPLSLYVCLCIMVINKNEKKVFSWLMKYTTSYISNIERISLFHCIWNENSPSFFFFFKN